MDLGRDPAQTSGCNIFWCVSQLFKKGICCLIAFRMHACSIQWIITSCDTHKSGTLFKSLRTQLCHLQKTFPVGKTAIFFSVGHNVFCNGFTDAWNIFQQGGRCSIQIHTYLVHTVLNYSGQSFSQLFLVHIMLILTNTNGLRIDLYQFCQRILYTPCNGSCASLSYIKVRELFCGQLACRIYRSTSFIGDHVLYACLRDLLQHVHDHLLWLSGSSTISNRDQGYLVLSDHFLHSILGCTDLSLIGRCSRINHCGIQHLSCGIYHCQLTSGTECRIPSKHNLPCNGRLHKKLLQILSKYLDGAIFCLIGKIAADLPFNGRCDQSFVAVIHHFF